MRLLEALLEKTLKIFDIPLDCVSGVSQVAISLWYNLIRNINAPTCPRHWIHSKYQISQMLCCSKSFLMFLEASLQCYCYKTTKCYIFSSLNVVRLLRVRAHWSKTAAGMTTLLELCWQHGNCQQQKIFKIRSDWLPRSCCDSGREAHVVIPNLLHYSQTYKILFTRPWNVLEFNTTERLLNKIFESIKVNCGGRLIIFWLGQSEFLWLGNEVNLFFYHPETP